MRTATAVIFFGVFFLVTGLVSFYIFIRGLQAIPPSSSLRNAYIAAFWTIAVSFIAGRLLENAVPSFIADTLIWAGSFWMAATLYFLIAVVLLDLVRLINYFFPIYPALIRDNYALAKYVTAISVLALVTVVVLAGHVNSLIPRVVTLDLRVPKRASKLDHLTIVSASDIHLGTIVGRARFDGIVKTINSLAPDVVLLPGDIVDEDLRPVIRQNLGESLQNIRARFGVYAVTGNHEYIGGVEEACRYLVEHNITMLRDESVKVADSFYLIGREDRSSTRFMGPPRKQLAEILKGVDRHYPAILMDHQPFGLAEAAEHGLDLQLSGHTHYGQLWPLNYIVKRIYELAWGYRKIAQTHYYVSNGVGTWGPPVRVGNRPEIMRIRLSFE